MSQATQSLPLKHQLSAHRVLAVSALLALLATTAVVLVLTIDGGFTQTSAPAGQSTHPRVLWNGRPAEGAVPAPAAARTSPGPDESRIAASIGGSASKPATAGRPDESGIAASIGSASEASPKVGEIKVSPSIRH
jgi:hypothetical protein